MFEDTNQPEDMFDATDKVAPQVTPPTELSSADLAEGDAERRQTSAASSLSEGPAQLGSVAPVSGSASSPAPTVEERIASISDKRGGFPWKVILLMIGILVVIGAAFLLSMKILDSKTPVTPEPPADVDQAEEVVEEEVVEEIVEEEVVEEESEPEVSRKDTDKDGLTDEEEKEYGTSIRTADTDSDGLFDLEEIKTWETDPLNPDTDGDGYLDGEEVDGGYNPNGEGVLREASTESS